MIILPATNMFIDTFIENLRAERRYSTHTLRAYKTDLRTFEEYLMRVDEGLTLLLADSDLIRGWMAELMDEGKSASSVNRRLSTLRTFYDFMCAESKISENPTSQLHGPKQRRVLPAFLKEDDMDAVIDNADDSDDFNSVRNRAIVVCFYETGMRLSELIGLDVDSVDVCNKQLKVFGKRSRERIIPFVDELQHVFENYFNARKAVVRDDEKALFVSCNGHRLSSTQVYRIVRRVLEPVAQRKKSPHILRHTFATAMLNNSAELGAVKELLGHKRLSTTEMYTHLTFEELKRYYKKAHPRAGK